MSITAKAVRECIADCLCPICGAGPFKVLAAHTNRAHGVDRFALRELADLPIRASVCSNEFAERARELALQRDFGHSEEARIGRARGAAAERVFSDGARARLAAAARERMLAVPEAERREHASRMAAARTSEGLGRIAAAASRRVPSKAEVEAFRERMTSPEVEAKRESARVARLQGHGTVACYKRGCRCEPCRDAKRVSRRASGGGER